MMFFLVNKASKRDDDQIQRQSYCIILFMINIRDTK